MRHGAPPATLFAHGTVSGSIGGPCSSSRTSTTTTTSTPTPRASAPGLSQRRAPGQRRHQTRPLGLPALIEPESDAKWSRQAEVARKIRLPPRSLRMNRLKDSILSGCSGTRLPRIKHTRATQLVLTTSPSSSRATRRWPRRASRALASPSPPRTATRPAPPPRTAGASCSGLPSACRKRPLGQAHPVRTRGAFLGRSPFVRASGESLRHEFKVLAQALNAEAHRGGESCALSG
jgi:hypothetical protein